MVRAMTESNPVNPVPAAVTPEYPCLCWGSGCSGKNWEGESAPLRKLTGLKIMTSWRNCDGPGSQ